MTLHLSGLRYLFEAPAIDPMAGSHLGRSGLDEVMLRLKREKLPRNARLELTVRAPAAEVGTEAAEKVQQALAAHLQARIESEEDGLHFLRRETAQSLRVGGLFLVVCLVLSAFVDRMTFLSPFLQSLAGESLVIAGWVGLWHPLDLLLYSSWPNRYRIGLLKHLQGASVSVEPA
jgi:hypothetical protein